MHAVAAKVLSDADSVRVVDNALMPAGPLYRPRTRDACGTYTFTCADVRLAILFYYVIIVKLLRRRSH